jgi:tetratricopeptide (TPR) repeat protein
MLEVHGLRERKKAMKPVVPGKKRVGGCSCGARAALGWMAVFAALSFGMGCEGKAEKIERLLASGKTYFEEGKFREAVIQFKNIIQQDPKSAAGYYHLGLCYLRLKNPLEAYKSFLRSADLDPEFRDARLQVGNLSLLFGELEKAKATADALIEKNKSDWEGWVLLARVFMMKKDDAQAGEAIAMAMKEAPQEVLPQIMEGRLLEKKGEGDRAGELYERLWRQFPESFEVERVLFQFYAAQGKQDQVVSLAEQTLPREAHRSQRLPFLAHLYLQMGKSREASAVCVLAVENAPGDPDLRLLAGRAFLAHGDFEKAEAQWRKGLELAKEDERIRTALSELFLRQERLEEGEKLIQESLTLDPGNVEALLLMGRVRLLQRRYADAQKFFQDALERSPEDAAAHYFLGLCFAQAGQRNLAVMNLKKALDENPSMETARKALAELHLEGGEVKKAEDLLAPLVHQKKADKETVILFSEVLRREGRNEEAMSLLEREEISYPLDKAFPIQKGRVQMTAKNPDTAERFFQDALRLDPASQEAVFRTAQILLEREGPERATSWIETKLPDMESKAPFYDLLGKIALRSGDTRKAEEYLKTALDADPNLLDGYLSLASLYLGQETKEKALQIAEDLGKKKPDSPVGPMLQGMILESMGQMDPAIDQYEKVLSIRPDFGPAANNLAYLYLEERNDRDRALPLAEKARKQLPDNPAVADTLGWVYEKMGLHQKALNLFLEAVEQLPNHPTVCYHLGVAYAGLGRNEQARESFGKALAMPGDFPQAEAARNQLENLTNR